MDEIDKAMITTITMIIIFILLLVGMISTNNYLTKKLETEQPKYFIEFKGNLYELKEVE